MKRKLLVLLISILGISLNSNAAHFEVLVNGNTLYFNITSHTSKTVEVTCQTSNFPYWYTKPTDSIMIPNTVENNGIIYSITSIGDIAFTGCSDITYVELPNSITSIGDHSFSNCSSLISVNIPSSVTLIKACAFYECTSLSSIIIPNSVNTIEPSTFSGCTNLTVIIVPNSITSIKSSAFSGCSNLTSINLPNSIDTIGEYVFSGCTSLISTNLPISITSIEYRLFYGCSSLTSIDLPESITKISDYAFYGCSSLSSINLPESITTILDYAFSGCISLASITSNAIIPPTLQINSFKEVPKTIPINVPCSSLQLYQTANVWKKFTNYQCFGIGINEIINQELQTKLYPNPTSSSSRLEIENVEGKVEITITDISGRVIQRMSTRVNSKFETTLDLTNQSKGIYFISIVTEKTKRTEKLILK
ncbi:MAG: leucine-rich repeat domain-containing protein [Bacteroidales bacterium]